MEIGHYPRCEVHSSSSVQQQGGDIDVTIVSRDVQRGEPTLFDIDKERRERKKVRGPGVEDEGLTQEETEDCLKQQLTEKEDRCKRGAG